MNYSKPGPANTNSKENVLVKVPRENINKIAVYYPHIQQIEFCYSYKQELESDKGPSEPIIITYLFFNLNKKDLGKKIVSDVKIKKEKCNYAEKLCFDVNKTSNQTKAIYELNIRRAPATTAIPIYGTNFHAHFDKII